MTPEEANKKLFHAAGTGNVADARAALIAGADLFATNPNQETPLYLAAKFGHDDLAEYLENAAKEQGYASEVIKKRKDKGPPQVG